MQMEQIQTTSPKSGIRQYLEKNEGKVEEILDGATNIQAKSLINKFLFAMSQNDKLKDCSSQSILNALLFCAAKKMAPINGNIILVPYGTECQAQMGIKGIRELIYRNSEVKRIGYDIVREKDEFKLISGLNPSLLHNPDPHFNSPIIGSYAFAELHSGDYIIRYCPMEEIKKSKEASRSSNSPASPWTKFFGEMARLVPLRKLAKELIRDDNLVFDTCYKPQPYTVSSSSELLEGEPLEGEVIHEEI